MDEWYKLNQAELNPPREDEVHGLGIEIFLSPYDVPEAVRGYFDESKKRFVIEFRYIADEKTVRKELRKHLVATIGKNSDRIYSLEVDVTALGAQAVGITIKTKAEEARQLVTQGLNDLAGSPELKIRKPNYDVARNVIAGKNRELFQSLVTS